MAELYLDDQMDSEEADASPSEPVAVDPAVLDDYAGTYQLGPGSLVTITHEGNQLMTQATGEPKFEMTPTSEARFIVEAYGAAIEFKRDPSGVVTHLEYRDIHAPRVELFEPSRDELAAFEGDYFSEELGTTYTLVVEDSVLTARHRRHDDATLSPTITDTFTTDTWFMRSIHFVRDRARRVTGFEVSNDRSRNVRFAKVR